MAPDKTSRSRRIKIRLAQPESRTDSSWPSAAYYGSQANLTALTIGGTAYNLVKRDSLVGHSIDRVDVRLSKTFTVKDRFRFIPMVEAFNLFNHSNFGAYQTVVNLATYGAPAQQADSAFAARMLQFAGRFEF